jgi:hypothetical protein
MCFRDRIDLPLNEARARIVPPSYTVAKPTSPHDVCILSGDNSRSGFIEKALIGLLRCARRAIYIYVRQEVLDDAFKDFIVESEVDSLCQRVAIMDHSHSSQEHVG